MSGEDVSLTTAEEILNYAKEEFERSLKTGDMLLYRNAVDKAFLAMVLAINSYINRRLGVVARSHSERRLLLRKMEREDLRARYSDVMRTLHDEAFYEGIYNPDEARYAIEVVERTLRELRRESSRA